MRLIGIVRVAELFGDPLSNDVKSRALTLPNPVERDSVKRILLYHAEVSRFAWSLMENHKLVLSEHLNHYGFLFGGHLLKWVDEVAWIAASQEYPDCQFVTVAMDRVEFKKSVPIGTILKLRTSRVKIGITSVSYEVLAIRDSDDEIFSTTVTLVRIGPDGQKMPISK